MKNVSDIDYYTVGSEVACEMLGVSAATLYAYVSRGYIRAIENPENTRKSLYDRRDIETLYRKKDRSRKHRDIATSTIDWGEPVLHSEVSAIVDGQCFYRGIDAVSLSETASFEDVFQHLQNEFREPISIKTDSISTDLKQPPYIRMFEVVSNATVCALATDHPIDTSVLLRQVAMAAAGVSEDSGIKIHKLLSEAWSDDERGEDLIRRALVLCADHELNASTFSVRVAASTNANLPACVLVGLSTLSGARHGGVSDHCLAWINEKIELDSEQRKRAVCKEPVPPGFGHPLYPDGDPRAASLLALCSPPEEWTKTIDMVAEEHGVMPTIDFALIVLEQQLQLPKGAALAMFAMGRMAGWVAHIQEQKASGKLIRPRAIV